jgi:exopolysaccharide biosynthesis protein
MKLASYIRSGRQILTLALALSLITPSAFAGYQTFYTSKTTDMLSKGVAYEKILKLTDGGWVNVNVLRIDLTDPDLSVKPIYPTYLSSKAKLSTVSNLYPNLIGSVNADFFDPASGSTLGPIVDEGTLITTPNGDKRFASLNITDDNIPFINYWANYNLKLIGQFYTMDLNYVNKPYLNYDRAIVFNSKWGTKSFGKTANMPILEMYIENGIVTDFRENGEPFALSESGYVVAAVGKKIEEMRAQYHLGDVVDIDYDFALKNIDFTIGGGSVMVKDGKAVTNFTLNIAGQHPRTAAGITQDKKQLFLLTVDGRTSNFRGLTQPELAEMLIELGAYDAINLDGGGSTTMVVRPVGSNALSVANTPSDGAERRVYNGIGVISTAQGGTLDSLILNSADKGVFNNIPIELSLKGIDANRSPVALDAALVKWSVTGVTGSFNGSTFTPTSTGRAVLTAAYGNLTATKTIDVYKTAVDLIIKPSKLQLKVSEAGSFKVYGIDESGHQASIPSSLLTWTIPDQLITLKSDGTFTASAKPGKGVISATYAGIKKHMPIAVGESHTLLYDFEKPTAKFVGYPAEVTGSFALLQFSPNGSMGGRMIFDFTKTEATRAAYLMLGNGGIPISGTPDKLGVWVFGNYGYEHMLKGRLVDATGKIATVEFAASVNWEGWKFVEAAYPADLKAPVKIERLYVAEDNPVRQDRGVLVFDQLVSIRKNNLTTTLPKDVDKLPVLANLKVNTTGGTSLLIYGGFQAGTRLNGVAGSTTNTLYKNYVYAATQLNKASKTYFAGPVDTTLANLMGSEIAATKYTEASYDGVMVMTLNMKNNSILNANASQWKSFLNRVDTMTEKSLVIVTNSTLDFSDKLEEDLFYEKLGQLYDKGVSITIFSGGENKDPDLRMTRYAKVVDVQSLTPSSTFDLKTGAKAITVNLKAGVVTYQIKPVPLKR